MRKSHTKAGPKYRFNITKRVHKITLLQTRFFVHKSNVIQSLNNGNKTSGRYTWEAIHKVSLINIVLPLKLPTIWNRARPDGVT
jgi:hypothetical protein